jgi:hypothetical protein
MADLPKASLESKSWKEIAAEAWDGPSWKQAAHHHSRGERTVEIPPERLARLRRLMESVVTFEQASREINDPKNRPTPQVTVEAIVLSVRERGLAALKEPANVERLERCDAAAKAEIERRIAKLRKG